MSIAPLVGMHFRPPAKAFTQGMAAGHPLLLRPEPTNPYDSNAIAVDLDLTTLSPKDWESIEPDLFGFGTDMPTVKENGPLLHLGYIARTETQPIHQLMGPDADATLVAARFSFDMTGKPAVEYFPALPAEAEDPFPQDDGSYNAGDDPVTGESI